MRTAIALLVMMLIVIAFCASPRDDSDATYTEPFNGPTWTGIATHDSKGELIEIRYTDMDGTEHVIPFFGGASLVTR